MLAGTFVPMCSGLGEDPKGIARPARLEWRPLLEDRRSFRAGGYRRPCLSTSGAGFESFDSCQERYHGEKWSAFPLSY